MYLPRPIVAATSFPVYRLGLNNRFSLRTQRAITEFGSGSLRPPRGTFIEPVTLAGRPAERVSVGASQRPRAVLYLHGGGYVLGAPKMYRALAGYLALASGAVVYTLDYRLAPEHPYPAALDDAVAAFRELATSGGYPPAQLAVAGDSAGGGLAVGVARAATDAGLRPGALVLLSPWTDPADEDMPERDFVVNKKWGRASAALYCGDADPADPGYAPMHARLDGLPPTLIHVGAREVLNAQIKRFAARSAAAGVDVRLREFPTLWHSGHMDAGLLREATEAVNAVGAFLRTRLGARAEAATAGPVSELSAG